MTNYKTIGLFFTFKHETELIDVKMSINSKTVKHVSVFITSNSKLFIKYQTHII